MGIWMTAVLAAGLLQETPDYLRPADEAENRWTVDGVAVARVGVWGGSDFKFQATRTDGLVSTSKQQALFSASLLAGIEIHDHFMLLATVEGDVATKITAELAGLYVGWHQRPKERYGRGVPDEATVYAGVLGGSLKVNEDNFGDFDKGIGFGGGVSFGWSLSKHMSLELYGEYRYLKFDFQKDVVSGNDSIGGSTGWGGVGVNFRF